MGEVISGTLGDYVVLQRGTTYKSRLLGLPGPVLLGLSSIARNGGFRSDSLRTYGGESPDKLLLRVGDLFVSLKDVTQTGDLLGSVARVPSSVPLGRLTQDTVKLSLVKDVPTEYLYWILRTEKYRAYCRAHAIGTTNLSLSREDFLNFPIPSPTAERLRLVRLLDALEDKIAVNERISTTLLSLADSLFKHAVAGLVAGPETFGSVAKVHGGGTPRTSETDYWNGDIAWATPSDVTALSSPYLFATSRTITQAGLDSCASQLYPAGSIFMTSRATIGSFAVPQNPTAVNQGFIVVIPPRSEFRWWLFHEMKSRVHEMIGLANGSTFLELSRKNFRTMQVHLGDPSEIERFDTQVGPLHSRAVACVKENSTLTQLRDTLLPKLMSGELRVREAEGIVGGAL